MEVKIVSFSKTRVASISHRGPPWEEPITARKLVAWKTRHGLLDQAKYRSYGLHYTDPQTVAPHDHRVDFCLSMEGAVEANDDGIVERIIPELRCALARDVGSRANNHAVGYLIREWLPAIGETIGSHPIIFHYVNVGPSVQDHEAITDVYLPLG